jgi:acetyl-CoA acetyltransferase
LFISRELGVSEEKVNVNGGSIALGHPIGMPYLVMQNFIVLNKV